MGIAPFLAENRADAQIYWITASDGARLRMALWPKGEKGTVLLFTGRTDYIEKYIRVAAEFGARGYSVATIDWRGQGLSDRPKPDRRLGHVESFGQYQLDIAAFLAKLDTLGQSGPRFLVAHSMGGCIGLRALLQGLHVRSAAFAAPMWGIRFPRGLAPIAWALAQTARLFGQGRRYLPGTSGTTYVKAHVFADNNLTRNAEIYGQLQAKATAQPDLTLGGPSLHWLGEAMQEYRSLANLPAPDTPALCFLGTAERVIDAAPIHARMAQWPGATLEIIPGAKHEIMMDLPATQQLFYNKTTAFFDTQL